MTLRTEGTRVGDRTLGTAYDFMHDLAARLTNRVQLTTDGHRVYLEAVESTSNEDVDFAMLSKICRSIERQNLTMRMSMRRFTRLTIAFSKKLENHAALAAIKRA